jgi:ADP-heptose:LPS heptosyltransferase
VLHKEVPDDQRAWLNAHSDAVLHTEALADFADTAALIAEMDLVITVDTSVAHLAGALGKPVWIMLSSNPDWRWLRNRTDSPWYPTARLFRRGTREDWTDVVAAVGRALPEALIASPV